MNDKEAFHRSEQQMFAIERSLSRGFNCGVFGMESANEPKVRSGTVRRDSRGNAHGEGERTELLAKQTQEAQIKEGQPSRRREPLTAT